LDLPALLHVAVAKLKAVTIQAKLKLSILTRRMTLKTELSETYSMDKDVCALGDDSGQLKVIHRFSDIQSCLNVFLASINLRIDTKSITFE